MSTRAGFAMLRRAAQKASNKRATDYIRAKARGARHVAGLGNVTAELQRAVDAANAELLALGLNGYEAQSVLTVMLNRLSVPDYPLENTNDRT